MPLQRLLLVRLQQWCEAAPLHRCCHMVNLMAWSQDSDSPQQKGVIKNVVIISPEECKVNSCLLCTLRAKLSLHQREINYQRENWHRPVLLTLTDPRGLLRRWAVTDPRAIAICAESFVTIGLDATVLQWYCWPFNRHINTAEHRTII